jgi:hypothetical protein
VTATATSAAGEGVAAVTGTVSETTVGATALVEETSGDATEATESVGAAVTQTAAATPEPAGAATTVTRATEATTAAVTPALQTVEQTVESTTETATAAAVVVVVASASVDTLAAVDETADQVVATVESVAGLEQGTLGGVVGSVTAPVLQSAAVLVGETPAILDETLAGATGQTEPLLGGLASVTSGQPRSPGPSIAGGAPLPGTGTPTVDVPVGTAEHRRAPAGPPSSPARASPTQGTHRATSSGFYGVPRAEGPSARPAEPRRPDVPRPFPTPALPAAPAPSAGAGFSIVLFAVLAGLALLAIPRAGRRFLSSPALAPPVIFASPLERPG